MTRTDPLPLLARLTTKIKVNPASQCWEWMGSKRRGYGCVTANNKSDSTHRVMFRMFSGEIAEGFHICHKCDNPKCCNPDHLFQGTANDNIADMINKGRVRYVHGERSGRSKLKNEDAIFIYESNLSSNELAAKFGIHPDTVRSIKAGRQWGKVTQEGSGMKFIQNFIDRINETDRQFREILNKMDEYQLRKAKEDLSLMAVMNPEVDWYVEKIIDVNRLLETKYGAISGVRENLL